MRRVASRALRLVVPPLLLVPLDRWRALRHAKDATNGLPFDGAGQLWVALVHSIERYAEWGVGESTEFVLRSTSCRVRAVDTSAEWLERTVGLRNSDPRVNGIHVDLGPVEKWGRPTSYRHQHRINDYLIGPFDEHFDPEAVLVDGRFRVACFLSALLHGSPGMLIVFDDYVPRERYHIVERVLAPVARSGRQAVFVRPEAIDVSAVKDLLVDFKHVMD